MPAGVVGQVWRDGRVQVTLDRFLRCEEVTIVPLDEQLTRSCGELCGATNTARERRDRVVTNDANDLRRLDPAAQIIAV